jgi:hypothetical protein
MEQLLLSLVSFLLLIIVYSYVNCYLDCLKNNPEVINGSDTTLYLAGNFIGKNIQYLYSEAYPSLLPAKFNILTQRGEEMSLRITQLAKKRYTIDENEFHERIIE